MILAWTQNAPIQVKKLPGPSIASIFVATVVRNSFCSVFSFFWGFIRYSTDPSRHPPHWQLCGWIWVSVCCSKIESATWTSSSNSAFSVSSKTTSASSRVRSMAFPFCGDLQVFIWNLSDIVDLQSCYIKIYE